MDSVPSRMAVVYVLPIFVVFAGIVGCGGKDDRPIDPTPTVSSVSVTHPAGSIFIGSQTQFQATTTLSNGTTQAATGATWGSDAPAVATVSPTGLVTAMAAGVATIFADVNPRGTVRIRVLPNFGGTWAGDELVTRCEETGAFVGLVCGTEDGIEVGELLPTAHASAFTQTGDSVAARIIYADATSTMTGTIDVGGELRLPSAEGLPAEAPFHVHTQNWRSRADVPLRMTGSYEWLITADGFAGSVVVGFELVNVTRASATAGLRSVGGDRTGLLKRIAAAVEARQ